LLNRILGLFQNNSKNDLFRQNHLKICQFYKACEGIKLLLASYYWPILPKKREGIMKEEFKCEYKGCTGDHEELSAFTGFGDNKNKDDKRWYCEKHFLLLEEEGYVEVIKEN
jgi:hypothetical protein